MRIRIFVRCILVCILLAALTAACSTGPRDPTLTGVPPTAVNSPTPVSTSLNPTLTPLPTATPTPVPSPTPTPIVPAQAVIYGAGDVLLHDTFFNYPPDASGHYNYTECFAPLAGLLDDGYAVADYEGTLGGPPYTGYPRFSGPDDIVPALWNAGFRMMLTANNHTIDKDLAGVQRTAEVFRTNGFKTIGTRPNTDSESFSIVEVQGIRVGFAGFTFETVETAAQYTAGIRALNALPMPAGAAELIDSFNPYRDDLYEKDKAEMFARAALLRERGAEVVVFFIHWGEDYSWTDDFDAKTLAEKYPNVAAARLNPSPYVVKLAQDLADHGVDVIIGNHPHLVHKIDVIQSAVTGRPTLVYYSTGNMLSAMDGGVHNGRYRDGILARVTIRRDALGKVTVTKGEYTPLFCSRWLVGDRRHYQVLPVRIGLKNPASYNVTAGQLNQSLSNTLSILSACKGIPLLPVSEAVR